GPRGRPLVLLSDRASSAMFELRRSWRARAAADLDAATSIEAAIDAVGRVLPLNQRRAEIVGFLEWVRRSAARRLCEIGVESGGPHLLFKRAPPQIELTVGPRLLRRPQGPVRSFAPAGQAARS